MAEKQPSTQIDPKTGQPYGSSQVKGEGADPEMAEMMEKGRFKGTKSGEGAAAAADKARQQREAPKAPPSPAPTPKPMGAKPKRSDYPAGIVGQSQYNNDRTRWNDAHPSDKVSSLGMEQRKALA
jgi:hypothetical protein